MRTTRLSALERRQHILRVATEVFCELGYDGASMSAIAAKVGGSKGTLYNYFSSKDELLLAAMLEEAHEFQADIMSKLESNATLEVLLSNLVTRMVNKLYVDPKTAKLLRIVISVGDSSDIGLRFFTVLGNGIWDRIQLLLANKIESGELINKDPEMMTSYLRGLCEFDMVRLLMGAMPNFTPEQAKERSCSIIKSFFQTYRKTTE